MKLQSTSPPDATNADLPDGQVTACVNPADLTGAEAGLAGGYFGPTVPGVTTLFELFDDHYTTSPSVAPLCIDDAMPDSWGRTLVNHRLGQRTAELNELTYLLDEVGEQAELARPPRAGLLERQFLDPQVFE